MYDTTAAPTVADLRAWLEVSMTDDAGDQLLTLALAVATTEQQQACDITSYDAPLFHACLRRAARVFTAKSAALGRVDLGDMGSPSLLRWDALIDAGEAPYRRGGFA